MDIAFYAPMKAPDHPVPSGDRRMAQLLVRALRLAGHRVSIASRLRSYDGAGDAAKQRRLHTAAGRLAGRYIDRHREIPPDLWFTYHCYHKAPDLLGPAVADAFGIPLIVADASVAPKQAGGRWAVGYAAANAAIQRADRLIAFDPLDLPCLQAFRGDDRGIVSLPPLADGLAVECDTRTAARRDFARDLRLDPDVSWFAATAMMRCGAKHESYKVLARALTRLGNRRWALLVAGDGPMWAEVETLFAGFEAVRFLGQLDQRAIRRLHLACDLALWPAVGEGYCMALIEAQVAGLPAIAGDRPGIGAAIENETTGLLTPVGDAAAFASAIARLLDDDKRRAAMAHAAAARASRFSLNENAGRLDAILSDARRGI